jgi:DNA-binding FrmR family transcriptional regulator
MKQDIKKSSKRRLSIIAGQIRGLQDMVEQEKYCVDIITQIEAAREALAGVGKLVLKNHLQTHVAHEMRHGEVDRATDEILRIYRLAQR